MKENIPAASVDGANVTQPFASAHSVSNKASNSALRSSPTPQNKPLSTMTRVPPLLKGVSTSTRK